MADSGQDIAEKIERTAAVRPTLAAFAEAALSITAPVGLAVAKAGLNLSRNFSGAADVMAVHVREALQTVQDHDNDVRVLSGDAASVNNGRMARTVGNSGVEADIAEKRKKDEEFSNFVLLYINALNDYADRLAEEAQALREEIAQNVRIIDANSAFIEKVDSLLEVYKKDGSFNRDEALRLLRERGVDIDEDAEVKDILDKLHDEKLVAREDNDKRDQENKEKDRLAQEKESRAREARQAAKDYQEKFSKIDSDPHLDAEQKAAAFQRVITEIPASELYLRIKSDRQADNLEALRLPSGFFIEEDEDSADMENSLDVGSSVDSAGVSQNTTHTVSVNKEFSPAV